MRIRIISFTENGARLAIKLKKALTGHETEICHKGRSGLDVLPERPEISKQPLSEICRSAFEEKTALVFIGAMGIAVRQIAPFVRDKLQDPPVIVIDELGQYVIPVLSGHVGGANELAIEIAGASGAVPVVTTATDINNAFPADLFAKENGLKIVNRDGIARVSSSALSGRPVTISIKDYPPKEHVDVLITDAFAPDSAEGKQLRGTAELILCPKRFALGMGCRRGKSFEELRDFALRILEDKGISREDVGCIATIDVKKDEAGLRTLSQAWSIPLVTFSAGVLACVPGEFSSSETVLEKVGVDNVCERAAVLAAGAGAELIINKTAENGITAAVAERKL